MTRTSLLVADRRDLLDEITAIEHDLARLELQLGAHACVDEIRDRLTTARTTVVQQLAALEATSTVH
jgi:hypothetical protein